jgi:hypothetical protein
MKKQKDESLLTKAAKAIGNAAGKVVASVGGATNVPQRKGKLPKKHKSRLPRLEKKAAKKVAAKKAR